MDKVLLQDAISQLLEFVRSETTIARPDSVRQFNAFLQKSKEHYPNRLDIQVIGEFNELIVVTGWDLLASVLRLDSALKLRNAGTLSDAIAQVRLPVDAPDSLKSALSELEGAISLGLAKSVLLLAGSMAESLLLLRHPDKTDYGPGLKKLVEQARSERLFGRDTIRHLETLIDYRDIIHPRAALRNSTPPNEARMEMAILSLKLLCSELEDIGVVYRGGA
jgi:hypothetical protein